MALNREDYGIPTWVPGMPNNYVDPFWGDVMSAWHPILPKSTRGVCPLEC